MLTYLDHATWIDDATRVDWIFEIGVVPDAVDCRGSNYFNVGAAPGTTEVALTGIIAIDLSRVRGVPRLFHGLAPRVEGYLIERVRPNLVAVARAVGQLLEAERRPG
jgi:hypothetical protein